MSDTARGIDEVFVRIVFYDSDSENTRKSVDDLGREIEESKEEDWLFLNNQETLMIIKEAIKRGKVRHGKTLWIGEASKGCNRRVRGTYRRHVVRKVYKFVRAHF